MTAELVRDESQFTRTLVWELRDKPRHAHPEYHEIEPRSASLTLDRNGENNPWEIESVVLSGARIIKGGKVGASWESQYYTWHNGMPDETAPGWLVPLVNDAYEQAECERAKPAVSA